ncbi:MAG: Tad domain-containing protein [Anaerolineales bacterium]|nr:Tad domain-containing protein [Anaerolineales bacterium]
MNKMKSQKGQALILIAFGVVALIGFTALAVDGGRAFSDRRHAQNAADTAVLAAALDKINNPTATSYKTVGATRATSNGYTTGVNGRTVEVNLCNESGVTCTGLPTGAATSEYIRVKITSIVPLTFGRVLGRQSVTNVVEAIARVQGSTSSGWSFGNAGMVATKSDNSNQCFLVNGNANIYIHGAGTFTNCTGSQSVFFNGSSTMTYEGNVASAGGCYNQGGTVTFKNGSTYTCPVAQQTINASTFASVPTMPSPPACASLPTVTATVSGGNKIFPPGRYVGGQTVDSGSNGVLNGNGTYCFEGGLNLNGQANLTGTGSNKVVLGGNSLNLTGSANTFSDLEVYVTTGTFRTTGTLTSPRFRFYSSGAGNFTMQNGVFTSTDTYIYNKSGTIDINSQSKVNIHAPASPDPYAGLLFHMPWGNTSAFNLNGGTSDKWYGTVMAPSSDVTYNGGSGFELHGQVIANTFKVNGSTNVDIWYNPADNYNPPNNPTIELTK